MTYENKQKLIERNQLKRKNGGWDCKYCSCNFDTKRLLYKHISDVHKDKTRPNSINTLWECKYCLVVLPSRRKLFEHYKVCEAKNKLPHDSIGRIKNFDAYKKAMETLKKEIQNGDVVYVGHKHSDETRAKLAEIMRKRHNLNNYCNYSDKACNYIDELNKKRGWHLQHAKNGGEVCVGPYHLDGYDKTLNIAFEYDERKHKYTKEHDIARMRYIIKRLGCTFWRYNEVTDELYEFKM